MNVYIKNEVELGQKIFRVDRKSKNIYKPCTLCNNTRKVEITEESHKWFVECPKCANKQIKGDESSCISVLQYSSAVFEIMEVAVTYGNKIEVRINRADERYSRDRLNLDTMRDSSGNLYYLDHKDCNAEVRKLNAVEKKKERDFLEGITNGD